MFQSWITACQCSSADASDVNVGVFKKKTIFGRGDLFIVQNKWYKQKPISESWHVPMCWITACHCQSKNDVWRPSKNPLLTHTLEDWYISCVQKTFIFSVLSQNSICITLWRPLVNRLSPRTNRTPFCLSVSKEFLPFKPCWLSNCSSECIFLTFLDLTRQQDSLHNKRVFWENFKISGAKVLTWHVATKTVLLGNGLNQKIKCQWRRCSKTPMKLWMLN